MKLESFIDQGFKLFCKMYPSDKYAQGIDIDFTEELSDRSVPGVYILTISDEEVLKIGQSSHLGNRFNRMYKCVSNTTNDKVRAHVRDYDVIWVYAFPMPKLKHMFNVKGKAVKLETSFAPSLEKYLLSEYKKLNNNELPLLNSAIC